MTCLFKSNGIIHYRIETLLFCYITKTFSINYENAKIYLIVLNIIAFYVQINVSLAVFNLIPVPPFDGSRILFAFLPTRAYLKVME